MIRVKKVKFDFFSEEKFIFDVDRLLEVIYNGAHRRKNIRPEGLGRCYFGNILRGKQS